MELNFVIPGHYKRKGQALNDDVVDVIRVLGEDPNKPNFFLIQGFSDSSGTGHESLHESLILSSYELMNTVASIIPNDKIKKLPDHILAGITEAEPEQQQVLQPNVQIVQQNVQQVQQVQQVQPVIQQTPQFTPEQDFAINILKKLKQTETSKLSFNLTIDVPYNLTKLRESIDLLNLDRNTITEFLINELNLLPTINKSIQSALISNIEIVTPVQQVKIVEAAPIVNVVEQVQFKQEQVVVDEKKIQENNQIISAGINEINERFSHLTSSII